MVAACGPEKMMVKVTALCDAAGVASESSLERYMKCATGICDACTVGPGLRLCVEGPVLSSAQLKGVPEYGVGHRDAAGILHPW
jgi:dihydroorotate dehydrogenase electron transfer subunit